MRSLTDAMSNPKKTGTYSATWHRLRICGYFLSEFRFCFNVDGFMRLMRRKIGWCHDDTVLKKIFAHQPSGPMADHGISCVTQAWMPESGVCVSMARIDWHARVAVVKIGEMTQHEALYRHMCPTAPSNRSLLVQQVVRITIAPRWYRIMPVEWRFALSFLAYSLLQGERVYLATEGQRLPPL